MAVQLQITLPLEWASDFDRVAERWYFFHRPSGYCQYPLPKAGDEITRAAELVPRLPPRPAQQIATAMEAMSISQDKQRSVVTAVAVQQTQSTAPVPAAAQIIQMPQQIQQPTLELENTVQQNVPGTLPDPIRRASGSVARKPLRKPLPRQNSAPQPQQEQQHAQTPVPQRQDSQISPRTSISQPSIPGTMVQTQQPLAASPRSSISGSSFAELPMQQSPQQYTASSRSSVSQASILESTVQLTHSQSLPTNSVSYPNQVQHQNSIVQSPQQLTNPQYASTTVHSPGITPIQEWTETQGESGQAASIENPGVSSWAEEFGEGPQNSTQYQSPYSTSSRPKLANRLSTSAIKMTKKSIEVSKKSYESSKGYIKAHPGKSTAIASGIVGGVGVVANACGADGLSDAVAASKVYLNVKRAAQRKRISHSAPHGTAQDAPAGAAQNAVSPPATAGPSAQEVAHELFKLMQQQGQLPTMGQNPASQNNNSQPYNQGAASNAQAASQQYLQPQLVPQPLFVQPDPSTIVPPFVLPSTQSAPQTSDPSILAYQPPSSPTIPVDPQTLLPQYPTPPLSFSDPSSPTSVPFDPSTPAYDQFLQDQTATAMTNQATLGPQTFTTSITEQDISVQGDGTGQVTEVEVDTTTVVDGSASWTEQSVTVADYESDGDYGDDYDF